VSKKVLVTGGNKGIGLATTKKFLDAGYLVIILARDLSTFDRQNDKVAVFEFDLKQVDKIPQVANELGDIDILINNAGLMQALPYDEYPDDKKEEILKVNLEAPIALIREFAQGMIKKGKGRIINVASIAGQIGHPDIWYGVSKAGLINVTKSFAKILGPDGIVVNAIAPGPVKTDLLATIPEERKAKLKKATYLGRFAEPEEVAESIFWLATKAPEYINGFCIDINNGAFPR
jgi:3-oxoacyl-[acyl-carrier protein] reductase